MAKAQRQLTFAAIGAECFCGRCGAPCRVNPVPGSKARMMKRADEPKGLCVNCATHDVLRHLYPSNLILERSHGRTLAHLDIQREFFEIAQMHGTDVAFEEINWNAIIANWDLPFPTRVKRFGQNPVTEEELAMARLEGDQRRAGTYKEPLTEEEFETQRQVAVVKFLDVMHGNRHGEDTPTDRSDRD